jgi:hypothetical protein
MKNILNGHFEIRGTQLRDISGILALRRSVRPSFANWGGAALISQIQHFSKGQYVVTDRRTGKLVGALGTLIVPINEYGVTTSWGDMTADGTFENHDSLHGHTLVQAFCLVDRKFEAEPVRNMLYLAEKAVAKSLGLERIRAGIPLKHFFVYSHRMRPTDYVKAVRNGLLADSWIEEPLKHGFEVLAVVPDYYNKGISSEGYGIIVQRTLKSALVETINSGVARLQNVALAWQSQVPDRTGVF